MYACCCGEIQHKSVAFDVHIYSRCSIDRRTGENLKVWTAFWELHLIKALDWQIFSYVIICILPLVYKAYLSAIFGVQTTCSQKWAFWSLLTDGRCKNRLLWASAIMFPWWSHTIDRFSLKHSCLYVVLVQVWHCQLWTALLRTEIIIHFSYQLRMSVFNQ